jgi:IS5 family transposase
MLKKKFKATYRDVVDYLLEMPDIRQAIELTDIPHYTTIQKFFKRINELKLLSLIEAYSCEAIAVDSTGFTAYSSSYYDKIAKKSKKKRYQKMLIAIDVDKQLILNTIPAIGYKHDSKFFIPLIKQLKAKYFIADKGYDSTDNIK